MQQKTVTDPVLRQFSFSQSFGTCEINFKITLSDTELACAKHCPNVVLHSKFSMYDVFNLCPLP